METLDASLTTYGLAAACAIMLVKAVGVPLPIPGDFILLAMAARAAEGKVVLWVAFAALLAVIVLGNTIQFFLARGPARSFVLRFGRRIGITQERLTAVALRVQRGGVLGIALAVLTPGVRSAAIPACGLAGVPPRVFVPGLTLGSVADLALHFAIGVAGVGLLVGVAQSSPLIVVVVLALLGLAAWLFIARRRRMSRAEALNAWAQATCPVCLALGSFAALDTAPAREVVAVR
ncbi:MAG TPA: VTT domain-containing protein [Chloroflexota bacterium]|nr:VTT domain-containing protein [Chloroflexota bacterium]